MVACSLETPPAGPTSQACGDSHINRDDLVGQPHTGEDLSTAMSPSSGTPRTEPPPSSPPPYEEIFMSTELWFLGLSDQDEKATADTFFEPSAPSAHDDEDFGSDSDAESDGFPEWQHLLFDDLPVDDDDDDSNDDEYQPGSPFFYDDFEELALELAAADIEGCNPEWYQVADEEVAALESDAKRWMEMSPEDYAQALEAKRFFLQRREGGVKGPKPPGGCSCA